MSSHNEQGETTRRNWFSRFSRARRDLSTSVEEALLDEHQATKQDIPDTSSHAAALSTLHQSLPGLKPASKETKVLPATNKPYSRPTKVRLETAPAPAVTLVKEELAKQTNQSNSAALPKRGNEESTRIATSDMQALDLSADIPTGFEVGSPFLDRYRLETRDSSMRLPAVTVSQEQVRSTKDRRETLSGSGSIEAGHRDILIENTLITGTAVVLVMMTSNPGPAVVHYVSLQPAVGFTVHLSSPVMAKTSFNYIVLLGELP